MTKVSIYLFISQKRVQKNYISRYGFRPSFSLIQTYQVSGFCRETRILRSHGKAQNPGGKLRSYITSNCFFKCCYNYFSLIVHPIFRERDCNAVYKSYHTSFCWERKSGYSIWTRNTIWETNAVTAWYK